MSTLTVAELSAKIAALMEGFTITEATPATTSSVEISLDDLKAILAARAAVEVAEREKDRVEAEFKKMLGDAEAATVKGQVVITFKNGTRKSLDQKALKEQRPEIAEEFTKESPTRPLLLKNKVIANVLL